MKPKRPIECRFRRAAHVLDDERGAVALLALAGILITFMTALILFDGGFAIRHKARAQISADAASFSQAAVHARVMNEVSYMNVVKRTRAAIYAMYVGMMYQYYLEIMEDRPCIRDAMELANTFGVGTPDDIVDVDEWFAAGFDRPYTDINDLLEIYDRGPYSPFMDSMCENAYQQFEIFRSETIHDWKHIDSKIPMGAANIGYTHDQWYPDYVNNIFIELDNMQRMWMEAGSGWGVNDAKRRGEDSGADVVNVEEMDFPLRKGTHVNQCLNQWGHIDGKPTGLELRTELEVNRLTAGDYSEYDTGFGNGHPDQAENLDGGQYYQGNVGCSALGSNFAPEVAPWVPTTSVAQTSLIDTDRETPDIERMRSDHWLFLRRWEDLGHPDASMYYGTSCGEYIDLAPEYRGFRASWGPRVAPVGNCEPARDGWWK